MTVSGRQRQELREEAAARIVRAEAIGIAPDDDATLAAWRRGGKAREAAYSEVLGVWGAAGDLKEHPSYSELMGPPTLRERWAEWRARARQAAGQMFRPQRLAFASVTAAFIGSAIFLTVDSPWEPDYQTQVAQISEVPLADGSVITLGAKSSLDVDFNAAARRVELVSGEAFFSVSKDRNRPFFVKAGDTSIRVVGTKFNVNHEAGRVRVSVLEGVVEVTQANGRTERIEAAFTRKVTLSAGQQAIVGPAFPAPVVQPVPVTNPGGWREGRLSYQDAPLSDIIADANRYRTADIKLLSPSLGQERLTTSFKVSQIDQMLDQLPLMLPVKVERKADGTVNLKPV